MLKRNHSLALFRLVLALALAVSTLAYLAFSRPTEPELIHVALEDIKINSATGLREHHDLAFSGVAATYFLDGSRASEQPFFQGRRHGQLRKWFANGKLAFRSRYRLGRREGVSQSWWSNGNQRSSTHYLNDKPDGESWHWYQTGEKFKRYNFAAGTPAGLQQGWRKNGKLFSNFEYRNGRAYGLRNSNLCVELKDEAISIEG